jgi:hypothetical protein
MLDLPPPKHVHVRSPANSLHCIANADLVHTHISALIETWLSPNFASAQICEDYPHGSIFSAHLIQLSCY